MEHPYQSDIDSQWANYEKECLRWIEQTWHDEYILFLKHEGTYDPNIDDPIHVGLTEAEILSYIEAQFAFHNDLARHELIYQEKKLLLSHSIRREKKRVVNHIMGSVLVNPPPILSYLPEPLIYIKARESLHTSLNAIFARIDAGRPLP